MKSIYSLTAQGRAELNARRPKLPADVNSVLLLVDGRRTVGELLALRPAQADDVVAALRKLAMEGYIDLQSSQTDIGAPLTDLMSDLAPTTSAPTRPGQMPALAPTLPDGDAYRKLKSLLTNTIQEHLGERGARALAQVHAATSTSSLMLHIEPLAATITASAGRDAAHRFVGQALQFATLEG